jgi:hypothetical protein
MAEEERPESETEYLYATSQKVKEAFLKAGWAESELSQLERWFRGEYLALQHPDREEL